MDMRREAHGGALKFTAREAFARHLKFNSLGYRGVVPDKAPWGTCARTLDAVTEQPTFPADWLPPEAPLAMPEQDLAAAPASTAPERPGRGQSSLWRTGMILATIAATAIPARLAWDVLSIGGVQALDAVTLGLFILLFGWIVFGMISAATGFVLLATGGTHVDETGIDLSHPPRPLSRRCAVLMPIYNEDAEAVMARVDAMGATLPAAHQDAFDFFLLSDSRSDEVVQAECAAFAALSSRWTTAAGLFYRRRRLNTGRKAGNIADWVRRWGGAYGWMIVLDADSVMEGDSLLRLAAALERNPRLGLLQTAPVIVRAESLFARLQQFASRLYGPLHSEGLAWWSGAEGNYWGHNAIIRVSAFAQCAGLPSLRGRKPFGGEILSHDFVEAALLRRAGWEVRMTTQIAGSYEECPPTLADMVVRERRWCQGNLQHSAIIMAKGLHWTSRVHLLRGVSTYLVAPLWLAFVIASTLQALRTDAVASGEWDAESLLILSWILVVAVLALLAPKAMSLAWALGPSEQRRLWGRPSRLVGGVLLEVVLSALIAPVLMMAQIRALIDVVAGRDSGWAAQTRTAHAVSWRQALRMHGWQMAAGIAFMAVTAWASPAAFASALPIACGLILAAPIEKVTASVAAGRWCASRGLLTTPEDTLAPRVLAMLANERPPPTTCGPPSPI